MNAHILQYPMSTVLGEWLESRRGKISQMELAAASGTTPASISRIESGEQHPKAKTIEGIVKGLAEILGEDVDQLRREAAAAVAGIPPQTLVPARLASFVERWNQIGDEAMREMIARAADGAVEVFGVEKT